VKGGGLGGSEVVGTVLLVGAEVAEGTDDVVVVVLVGTPGAESLLAERPTLLDEPHAEADNKTAVATTYGMSKRREEVEADMTKAPAEPRRRWLLLLVAAVVTSSLLTACSGSARSGTERVFGPPVSSSASTVPVTSTAQTTADPTTAPPSTTTARPTTTVARTTTTAARSAAVQTGCAASLAGRLAWTGSARQLVTVEGSGYQVQTATVTLWQRSGSCWTVAGGPWSGFVGYNGFSDQKHEGDGTTPTGAYGFGSVVYGNVADPGVHETYHRLVCGDWWDENASSSEYNTFQHVACNTTPSWAAGSEALWTETTAYPSFAVINYNTGPIVSGAGSAIFLHASTGGPTSGCVSIPLSDLDTFLRWMQPGESPLIVIGPASEIASF
jgi:L,D-peptidoglycan transpeptidase YkuD (ErfK/YbiS/YcfS/YnhG family)